jgi:uncharacterized protein (TIGR03067 family)
MNQPVQTPRTHRPCNQKHADQFLQSDAYRVEDEELIAHLETCHDCREYMDQQAAAPEMWGQLSTLLKPGEFDTASQPDFSAATTGHHGGKPAAAQDVLDALAPTDDPHKLGRLGGYEIIGVVGVGGMGVVLKAVDTSLDRIVAIKVMAPQLANNENARKRFAREARAAAAVLHPNVVPIHSVASGTSLPFLVMSYIRGGSLQKRLEKEGPLPLVEVLRIGSQVAAGLAAAHHQGLVHRDIKPGNILLEEGVERVTITDFGLARAVDDNTVTQQGTIAGTPQYMSPEQARGEQVDQQSDLFSLGSVLYAICTGRPPYRGDSSYGVMRKIIDERPTPIQELNPNVPQWLCAIIEKLMSRGKSERFASAVVVHELLESCLSHVQQPHAIPLPPIPGSHRSKPPRSIMRIATVTLTAMAFMTLAALALIVGLQRGGFLKSTPDPREERPTLIDKSADLPITEINVDIAERLIGREEHLTFSKLTSLDPRSAAVLAKHRANLSFPALQQITPEVALELASKEQLWLNLSGLTELSEDVAVELGKVRALSLDGLRTVTPEVAAALVRNNGTLRLGLTSLTPKVAEALGQHRGWLTLHGIRSLDGESAKALARHKHWLSLDGLDALTPEVAESLGEFNGTNLELKYVKSIDQEMATNLSRAVCRGGLYLDGLKTITPDVAAALSQGTYILSLGGLDSRQLDAPTLKAIEEARKTALDSLKVLWDSEMRESHPEGAVNKPVSEVDDRSAIRGKWQVTNAVDSGRVIPKEQLSKIQFVFTDKTLSTEINGRKSESTWTLRPARNPKEMELTENGVVTHGIYDLKGDVLRLCLRQGGGQRPASFDSRPDSQDIAFVLKRRRLDDEPGVPERPAVPGEKTKDE